MPIRGASKCEYRPTSAREAPRANGNKRRNDRAAPPFEHQEPDGWRAAAAQSARPTSDLSLCLPLSLQLCFRLRLGPLLRESRPGTAELQMEPALCLTAKLELWSSGRTWRAANRYLGGSMRLPA